MVKCLLSLVSTIIELSIHTWIYLKLAKRLQISNNNDVLVLFWVLRRAGWFRLT